MAYEKINGRGVKYYLHQRGKLYFFSKSADGAIDLPPGNWDVIENAKTGLPMLKKKV